MSKKAKMTALLMRPHWLILVISIILILLILAVRSLGN